MSNHQNPPIPLINNEHIPESTESERLADFSDSDRKFDHRWLEYNLLSIKACYMPLGHSDLDET